MSKSVLKSVYSIGSLLGVPALVLAILLVPGTEFVSALQRGLIFAVLGLTVGFLRPLGRWHWGVALATPLAVLFVIHVAFAGHFHATLLNHDVPLLVGVIAGGTIGGQLGARLRGGARHAA